MTFVKTLETPQPKNYGTDPYADGYDSGVEEDFGMDPYGEDLGGLDEGDMYIEGEDPMGEGQGGGLTLKDAENAIEQLYSLLEQSEELNATKKGAIKSQIDALKKQINQIAFKEGEAQQAALQELFAEATVIETQITGIDPTTGEQDPSWSAQQKIDQIKEQAKTALDDGAILESTYDDIMKEINRAQSIVDLGSMSDEQFMNVEEILAEAGESLNSAMSQPVKAQALAEELGKPVDEIMAAAESAGVDLDNLKLNDKFMDMLKELGIPDPEKIEEYNRVKGERETDMSTLKADIEAANQSWKENTQNAIPVHLYERSWDYFDKKDPQYKEMMGYVEEMREEIIGVLKVCDLEVEAGADSDQIIIEGTTYDFFTEDSGKLALGTTETELTQQDSDFAPAYNNTEANTSRFPEGVDNWYCVNDPAGYPEVMYTVD